MHVWQADPREAMVQIRPQCGFSGIPPGPEGPVLALHSSRHCEGICSTNMGWFSVQKATGRVLEWDMAEEGLGSPVKAYPQGPLTTRLRRSFSPLVGAAPAP